MKSTQILSLLVAILTVLGCENDDQLNRSYCDVPTDRSVKNQLGRVYLYEHGSNKFYYIGNVDTLQHNAGFVPCNFSASGFIPTRDLGLVVMYSGKVRTVRNEEEPLYFGIELTEFKKVD